MQYIEWVKQAANRLSASDSAKRDAEILLNMSQPQSYLSFAFGETELKAEEFQRS